MDRDKQSDLPSRVPLLGNLLRHWEGVAAAALAERRAHLYWAVVVFASGIGLYFALPFEPPLAPTLLAAAVFASLYFLAKGESRLRMALAILLLLSAGIALATFRASQFFGPLIMEETWPVRLSGRVQRIEDRASGAVRLTLDRLSVDGMAGEETPKRVRITVRTRRDELLPGARVETRAVLLPLSGPVMPGGYDFARQMWFEGIGGSGFAVGAVRVIEVPPVRSRAEALEALRLRIAKRIRGRIPAPEGTVAAALLTGMRGAIPDAVEEDLRRAGLAHLLAISGLHMALFVGTSFFLIRALLAAVPPLAARYPIKKWAALVAWAIGLGYLFLSGMAISTQRAFIMVSVALLAVLLDRRAISMRLVAIAAAVILVLQPEALLSPGFQMSFGAVVALVAVYKGARPLIWRLRGEGRSRWLGTLQLYFLGIVLSTLVAEAAIAPFAVFHFNRIALLGIPANLVAMPIMAFWVMPAGLVALFLIPLGLEDLPLAAMGEGIGVILSTAGEISALPRSTLELVQMPPAALVLVVLGGLWLALWRSRRLKVFAAAPFAAGLALWLAVTPPDILIGRDGRLVAIRHFESGLYYFSSGRAERFSRMAWQRALAQEDYLHFRALEAESDPRAGAFACRDEGCVFHHPAGPGRGPGLLAITRRAEGFRRDCRRADLLITALRPPRDCAGVRHMIDGAFLRRAGGLALWFGDGGDVRIETVNERRGVRPWVVRHDEGIGRGRGAARRDQ